MAWLISNPRLVVCESCMLSRQLNVVSFAECLVCIELPSIRILGRAEWKGDSTCRALDIMQHSLKRISFHQWLVLRGALCDILRHSCGKAFTKSGSTDLRQSLGKCHLPTLSRRYQVHCINRVLLTSSFVCSRNSMDFILDHVFLYASCTGSANLDRGLDFCSYPKAWHITVIGKDNSYTSSVYLNLASYYLISIWQSYVGHGASRIHQSLYGHASSTLLLSLKIIIIVEIPFLLLAVFDISYSSATVVNQV